MCRSFVSLGTEHDQIAIALNGERCSLVTQGCNRSFDSDVAQRNNRFYKLPFFRWFVAEKYLGRRSRDFVACRLDRFVALLLVMSSSAALLLLPRLLTSERQRTIPTTSNLASADLLLASVHSLTGWEEATFTVMCLAYQTLPLFFFFFFFLRKLEPTNSSCEEPDSYVYGMWIGNNEWTA